MTHSGSCPKSTLVTPIGFRRSRHGCVLSGEHLRPPRYAAAVMKPLVGGELDAQPRDPKGVSAVVKVLSMHPAFAEGQDLPFGAAVFGPQGADPSEFDARRETAEFLAVGLSALAFEDTIDERLAGALVTVAIGADAFSRVVRDIVLGLPVD